MMFCPNTNFAQPRFVVSYRRFGTACRFHIQGSNSPLTPQRQPEITASKLLLENFMEIIPLCLLLSKLYSFRLNKCSLFTVRNYTEWQGYVFEN